MLQPIGSSGFFGILSRINCAWSNFIGNEMKEDYICNMPCYNMVWMEITLRVMYIENNDPPENQDVSYLHLFLIFLATASLMIGVPV